MLKKRNERANYIIHGIARRATVSILLAEEYQRLTEKAEESQLWPAV